MCIAWRRRRGEQQRDGRAGARLVVPGSWRPAWKVSNRRQKRAASGAARCPFAGERERRTYRGLGCFAKLREFAVLLRPLPACRALSPRGREERDVLTARGDASPSFANSLSSSCRFLPAFAASCLFQPAGGPPSRSREGDSQAVSTDSMGKMTRSSRVVLTGYFPFLLLVNQF